jgi:hypothetical protein
MREMECSEHRIITTTKLELAAEGVLIKLHIHVYPMVSQIGTHAWALALSPFLEYIIVAVESVNKLANNLFILGSRTALSELGSDLPQHRLFDPNFGSEVFFPTMTFTRTFL